MPGPQTAGKPSGLRSTTRRGDAPVRARGPLEAPLSDCVVRAEFQVLSLSLSLSRWRKVGLPLEVW